MATIYDIAKHVGVHEDDVVARCQRLARGPQADHGAEGEVGVVMVSI